MNALLTAIVSLLSGLLPEIGSATGASSVVSGIISTLVNMIPLLSQWAQELIPEVQNIITVLKGSGSVTAEQMTTLATAEAQLDAAFEAAATAAGDPEVAS
jgi:hypothetical protein